MRENAGSGKGRDKILKAATDKMPYHASHFVGGAIAMNEGIQRRECSVLSRFYIGAP
jgi:hypothetical protein